MQCYYDPQPGAGPLTWARWMIPPDYYFQTDAGPVTELRRVLRERPIPYFAREVLVQRPGPAPRRFYKYTKKEHVLSFIEGGSFRVGTLIEYTNQEKYSGGILDTGEGTKTVYRDVHGETWNAENVPAIAKGLIGFSGGGSGHVSGRFQQVQVSENMYVFCVSTCLSPDLIGEFDEADSCYEITAPGRFIADAIEAMRTYGDFLGVFECVYHGRDHEEGTNHLHPLVLKPRDQMRQQEVRLAWRAYADPATLKAEIVSSRNLIGRARQIL